MAETCPLKPTSDGGLVHLKVKPVCKPDVQLKRSRFRVFGDESLKILHSFGYQCSFGANLCLMNEETVIIISGDLLVFLDLNSHLQVLLPSVHGGGFACIDAHPSEPYFAASEKGPNFCISVSSYPELTPFKTLKSRRNVMAFSVLKFHSEVDMLISISSYPENKVMIWQWRLAKVLYEITVEDSISSVCPTPANKKGISKFITSGEGKVKVWSVTPEKDDRDETSDVKVIVADGYSNLSKNLITCTLLLPDDYCLSATDEGFFLRWSPSMPENEVEKISMDDLMPCHKKGIGFLMYYDGFIISFGFDGVMKFWRYSDILNNLENDEDKVEVSEVSVETSIENILSQEKIATDLERSICIEPVKTFSINEKSSFIYAVICKTVGVNISFLIQDYNGSLWRADVQKDLSDIYTCRLLHGAGIHLTNMTMCSVYPLAAATSSLGDVIILNCLSRNVLCYRSFSVPATSLYWLDSKIDGVGASIIVGFSDGTVRWLTIAMIEEPEDKDEDSRNNENLQESGKTDEIEESDKNNVLNEEFSSSQITERDDIDEIKETPEELLGSVEDTVENEKSNFSSDDLVKERDGIGEIKETPEELLGCGEDTVESEKNEFSADNSSIHGTVINSEDIIRETLDALLESLEISEKSEENRTDNKETEEKDQNVKEKMLQTCSKSLVLQAVLKLHADSIQCLSVSKHSIMVSQGLDSKLFFTLIEDFSFKPIGFYLNHHEINSLAWINYGDLDDSSCNDERLLLFSKYSYFLEVDLPCAASTENPNTFYIEAGNCQVYKVNNLLQYRVLGDRIYDSDCEESSDLPEDGKHVLKNLKYEEKKEKRENREKELGISETKQPPEILCYLPSTNPGHIWLSLGKSDYGYLFEFALTKEIKSQPIDLIPVRALEILTVETVPVTALQYSPCGHFLFMGLQDGSLNTCYLERSFEPSSGYDFAKFQVHDPDFGSVKFLEVSSDGSLIATAACDGNIFVINFYSHVQETTTTDGILPAIFPEKVKNIDDIMSSKVLSIEEDLLRKLVVREKELKDQYLVQLDALKILYLEFKDRYDAYLEKCQSSLKRIQNIPKELLVFYQDISCSPTAINLFNEESKTLLQKIERDTEKDGVQITLMKEKYLNFFKSRIKMNKISVEDEEETVYSFRSCKLPTYVKEFQPMSHPQIYQKKIEENRTLSKPEYNLKSKSQTEGVPSLEAKLAKAMKDVIHYPENTPISGTIAKYNERKQERILIIQDLLNEIKSLEAIVPDEKCYQVFKDEIDALYFKFKDTSGFELVFPELLSSFSEKKENLISFLKKINEFCDSFNESVTELSRIKQLVHEHTVEQSALKNSHTNRYLSNRSELECEKHISSVKPNESEPNRKTLSPILKIDWELCKYNKDETFRSDKRRSLVSWKNTWISKVFRCYHTLLRTIKPKIDCEKKFFELRFLMKCIELNSLKEILLVERTSLKNIEDLEEQYSIEQNEIMLVEKEIDLLTSLREKEKKNWMNLYDEFIKIIGRKHKHKGYLKQIFKKKIRPDGEKKKPRRHTSSESSESEQNIDSEDDIESLNCEGVNRNMLEEATEFRLKRHEVEIKMKEYKRKIRATLVKRNAVSRRVKKAEDLLNEAHHHLNSLLVPRKASWESFKWPIVLYPENVHSDFITFSMHCKEYPWRNIMEEEMLEIFRNVNMDLAIVNNYIGASLFLVTSRVVSLEISDLVDVMSVLLPVIKAVSTSADVHFENILALSESADNSVICKSDPENESFNTIRKILETVDDPKDTHETDPSAEEKFMTRKNSQDISDPKNPLPSLYENFLSLSSSLDENDKIKELMQFRPKNLLFDKSLPFYSWKDVCDDVDLLGLDDGKGCSEADVEEMVSRAICQIDCEGSRYTLEGTSISECKPDYFMIPFTFSVTENEEVNLEDEISVSPEEEIKGVVTEVLENIMRLICEYDNPVTQEDESIYENKYPTFPGGGLMLTLPVLEEMESESSVKYPYTNFYQEVKLLEDAKPASQAVRIKPEKSVETSNFPECSMQSLSDFLAVNLDVVLKLINSYSDIDVSTSELEKQLSDLKKKVSTTKRALQNKHDLINEQQDLKKAMKSKFGVVLDLDELLDTIENPHFLIKKQEFKTKMEYLRKKLKKLKVEESLAMQSLDVLNFKDTEICYELLELRNEFRFLSKTYSSKHPILPKIGKVMKADTDPSGDFEG